MLSLLLINEWKKTLMLTGLNRNLWSQTLNGPPIIFYFPNPSIPSFLHNFTPPPLLSTHSFSSWLWFWLHSQWTSTTPSPVYPTYRFIHMSSFFPIRIDALPFLTKLKNYLRSPIPFHFFLSLINPLQSGFHPGLCHWNCSYQVHQWLSHCYTEWSVLISSSIGFHIVDHSLPHHGNFLLGHNPQLPHWKLFFNLFWFFLLLCLLDFLMLYNLVPRLGLLFSSHIHSIGDLRKTRGLTFKCNLYYNFYL